MKIIMALAKLAVRAKPHLPLILAALVIALMVGGNALFSSPQEGSYERYADQVIEACAKSNYPPSCYDTEIPKLMDQGLSMEESFEVTKIIQNRGSDYFYCHVLGHNLSAKETAKDPSAWTEVVARCPTGMCSNGCLHGAAQERFRDDALSPEQINALVPELANICEPEGHRNFTGLEQASCYHSLGHLTMYISAADIDVATNVCDRIAVKENGSNYTQTCYEGAYMQIFQPLEPEDFALVAHIPAKTQAEAETFCDSYAGERRAACHRESWPLYRESLSKPEGLQYFCSLVPNAVSEQRCYNAMFYVLTAQFGFNTERIVPICEGLPEKRMAQCFANSASRFIETDYRLIPDAVALCAIAEDKGVGKRCYDELLFYSSFNFHKGSEGFITLCNALPEPWKTSCLNGEGGNTFPNRADLNP